MFMERLKGEKKHFSKGEARLLSGAAAIETRGESKSESISMMFFIYRLNLFSESSKSILTTDPFS